MSEKDTEAARELAQKEHITTAAARERLGQKPEVDADGDDDE